MTQQSARRLLIAALAVLLVVLVGASLVGAASYSAYSDLTIPAAAVTAVVLVIVVRWHRRAVGAGARQASPNEL